MVHPVPARVISVCTTNIDGKKNKKGSFYQVILTRVRASKQFLKTCMQIGNQPHCCRAVAVHTKGEVRKDVREYVMMDWS